MVFCTRVRAGSLTTQDTVQLYTFITGVDSSAKSHITQVSTDPTQPTWIPRSQVLEIRNIVVDLAHRALQTSSIVCDSFRPNNPGLCSPAVDTGPLQLHPCVDKLEGLSSDLPVPFKG